MKKKCFKILGSVLAVLVVLSLVCVIATREYKITLHYYATGDTAEEEVENPFLKAAVLLLLGALGEGEPTDDPLDIQRVYAHGSGEHLTVSHDGKVYSYRRLTTLTDLAKIPFNTCPFYYEEGNPGQTMRNLPPQAKWQVDCFRFIFDSYFDYPEGWYQQYEEAVKRYRESE